jgi:FKBP-type peptidyl-prolyl cis-trans isomerase
MTSRNLVAPLLASILVHLTGISLVAAAAFHPKALRSPASRVSLLDRSLSLLPSWEEPPALGDSRGVVVSSPGTASRRSALQRALAVASAATAAAVPTTAPLSASAAPDDPSSTAAAAVGGDQQQELLRRQEETKFVQEYSDFVRSPLGFSYRDVNPASSPSAAATAGDRVVFDWSGYTIGYFGRPFQAKGGPQGGAFDKDIDYARTVLGSHAVVRGLELAMEGMTAGQVRQVIVPYGALSYPEDDPGHDRIGPKPSTFSGDRALNFVLQNPRLDRTLLFNVKVIRVDKPDGRGGFKRG